MGSNSYFLPETNQWVPAIPGLEYDAVVTGGPDCPDNVPLIALASRTANLNARLLQLEQAFGINVGTVLLVNDAYTLKYEDSALLGITVIVDGSTKSFNIGVPSAAQHDGVRFDLYGIDATNWVGLTFIDNYETSDHVLHIPGDFVGNSAVNIAGKANKVSLLAYGGVWRVMCESGRTIGRHAIAGNQFITRDQNILSTTGYKFMDLVDQNGAAITEIQQWGVSLNDNVNFPIPFPTACLGFYPVPRIVGTIPYHPTLRSTNQFSAMVEMYTTTGIRATSHDGYFWTARGF